MCSIEIRTFSVVYAIWSTVFVLLLLWILHKYINHHKETEMPKILHICGILFYIFSIAATVSGIAMGLSFCKDPWSQSFQIPWLIFALFYALHWNAVIIFYFLRLYYVFQSSILKLSNLSIGIFIAGYASFILSLSIGIIARVSAYEYTSGICLGIAFISAVSISMYISVMFIVKLFQVNRNETKNDNGAILLSTMTKCTILAVVSVTTSLILTLFQAVAGALFVYSDGIRIIYNSLVLMDIFTNIICMTLSYKFTDKYYTKICGRLDSRCRLCFRRMESPEVQLSSIQSV